MQDFYYFFSPFPCSSRKKAVPLYRQTEQPIDPPSQRHRYRGRAQVHPQHASLHPSARRASTPQRPILRLLRGRAVVLAQPVGVDMPQPREGAQPSPSAAAGVCLRRTALPLRTAVHAATGVCYLRGECCCS